MIKHPSIHSIKASSSRRTVFSCIISWLQPYRLLVALSFLLATVTVVLTLWIPILIGRSVDCIAGPGLVDFPALRGQLLRILAAVLLTAATQWCMNHINNLITFRVVRDLRENAFAQIHRLPLSWLDRHETGDLISRIVTDAEQFSDGLLMGLTQLFTGVLTILGTLLFMLSLNWKIALIVAVASPLAFLLARFISKRTYHLFHEQSAARGKQTAYVNEMLTNLRLVKTFSMEAATQASFDAINEELAESSRGATFYSSLTNPSTRIMYSMIYAAVTVLGCFLCIRTGFGVGRLTSFLSYTNQYTKPFNEISGVITEFQNAIASAERVIQFLGETPETAEIDESGDVPGSSPAETDGSLDAHVSGQDSPVRRGYVSFQNVSFSYDKSRPLIEGLNLDVRPGQKIAIVGPTGAGKTTVINLLMRFYDVDGGSICVDETDIRNMTRHHLRRGFGMVLQEVWLKSGTIVENIAYGKPDASREEIIAAAKKVHAHSFIERMPDGYDTVVGEDGEMLSQGQMQLICIARVMLDLPSMLILDEATSSIDTMTERRIQDAFDQMMQGRTSFVVAHRLSTIQSADRILVMQNGAVREQGTHDELLGAGGLYAELYRAAFENT